jgi:hypothetical protein
MGATWIKGLGLAALLAMTASASAQGPKKDMKRPDGDGPRGAGFGGGFPGAGGFGGPGGFGRGGSGGDSSEIQRIRAEVKELDAKISRLSSQIDDATRKIERAADKGPGKAGDKGKGSPPEFKKFGPDMKKFADKGKEPAKTKEMAKGKDFGKGGDRKDPRADSPRFEPKRESERPKGPPPGFGRGPGGFGRGPAGFGRGPAGFGRGEMNRFGPPPFGRGFGGPVPPGRFDARPGPRDGGSDIDARLSRIERSLEELRRELRSRR